jgi:hypothetical protein
MIIRYQQKRLSGKYRHFLVIKFLSNKGGAFAPPGFPGLGELATIQQEGSF